MKSGIGFPVFILGLHRSGTTLLYEMLAASGCFNIVTARHVIHFNELRTGPIDRAHSRRRLSEGFARLGIADRGVDIVGLTPDTPEEYGFILDNLHVGRSITDRYFHVFRSVMMAIQRENGVERPLLLKNPWDFGNGHVIRTLIPDAKLVYIHRNPLHVLSSLHRVVMAGTTRPDPYLAMLSARYEALVHSEFPWRIIQRLFSARPDLVTRGLIHWTSRFTAGYLKSLGSGLCDDRIDVHYERLCRRPNDTIAAILAHVGVTAPPRDYHAMIGANSSRVLPEIARFRHQIIAKLSKYAESVGYPLASCPSTV